MVVRSLCRLLLILFCDLQEGSRIGSLFQTERIGIAASLPDRQPVSTVFSLDRDRKTIRLKDPNFRILVIIAGIIFLTFRLSIAGCFICALIVDLSHVAPVGEIFRMIHGKRKTGKLFD